MGTQGPKKPNWLVLGAFGGSGEALSWGKKAKFHLVELRRLSSTKWNLVHIPMQLAVGKLCSRPDGVLGSDTGPKPGYQQRFAQH